MKQIIALITLASSSAYSVDDYQIRQHGYHVTINKKKVAYYQISISNLHGSPVCSYALDDVLDESTYLNPGQPTGRPWPVENTKIVGYAPHNWQFEALRLEESNLYGIEWGAPGESNTDKCLLAGHFTAPQAKPYFSRGYAWVNGNKVAVNVLDKTPPSLHIYLSDNDPQLRWRDRATLRVRVEVKDNLDPNPQVQLERITMTRRVLPGQVVQASPTPVRDGDVITLQRIPLAEYQLTFSAMDASYNRASFVRKVQIKLLGQGVLIM